MRYKVFDFSFGIARFVTVDGLLVWKRVGLLEGCLLFGEWLISG